jgi:hypothetical protein
LKALFGIFVAILRCLLVPVDCLLEILLYAQTLFVDDAELNIASSSSKSAALSNQ